MEVMLALLAEAVQQSPVAADVVQQRISLKPFAGRMQRGIQPSRMVSSLLRMFLLRYGNTDLVGGDLLRFRRLLMRALICYELVYSIAAGFRVQLRLVNRWILFGGFREWPVVLQRWFLRWLFYLPRRNNRFGRFIP